MNWHCFCLERPETRLQPEDRRLIFDLAVFAHISCAVMAIVR